MANQVEPRKCSAHRTNGDPCDAWAVRGCNVCIAHGAGAPQVRRAAAMRVLEFVDPALANVSRALDHEDIAVRMKASYDVLDRAGLAAIDRLQLLNPTHEDIDLSSLSDEQLATLRGLAEDIARRKAE